MPNGVTHSCVLNLGSVEAEGKDRGEEEEKSHGGSMVKALASPREGPLVCAPYFNLTGQPHSWQRSWG